MSRDLSLVYNGTSVGNVSYNGFTFPAARKASANVEAIYDTTGRSIKYHKITIELDTVIVQGMQIDGATLSSDIPTVVSTNPLADTDVDLESIRQRLLQPGQALLFDLQGFGTVAVNSTHANNLDDRNYGPKPSVLSWTPLGSNKACNIVWAIETWVYDCGLTNSLLDNKDEDFFEIEWSINESGLATRTIKGEFTYAASRIPLSGSKTASNQFDSNLFDAERERKDLHKRYLSLEGFHRTIQTGYSPDKRTVSYTIIDTEINSPEPYFPGMVEIDADYSIGGQLKNGGFGMWEVGLDVSLTRAPNTDKFRSYYVFTVILASFVDRIRARGKAWTVKQSPGELEDGTSNNRKPLAWPVSFSMSDKLYGRTTKFRIQYWLVTEFNQLFQLSGFLEPLAISPSIRS